MNLKATSKKSGQVSQNSPTNTEGNDDFVQMASSDSDLDPPRKDNKVEEEIRNRWERYYLECNTYKL